MGRFISSGKKDASGDQQLHKICCDASKLALEHIKGMSGQVLTPAPFTCLPAALSNSSSCPAYPSEDSAALPRQGLSWDCLSMALHYIWRGKATWMLAHASSSGFAGMALLCLQG